MKKKKKVPYDYFKGAPSIEELKKQFNTNDKTLNYMIKYLYPEGKVVCPYCGNTEHVYRSSKNHGYYSCFHCITNFSLMTGTVFEGKQFRPKEWIYMVYQMFVSRKGISAYQLCRETGLNEKYMRATRQQIQTAMNNYDLKPFSGEVEIDEAYVGGSNHGHFHNPTRHGKKYLILGVYEKGSGRVYSHPAIPNENGSFRTGKQLKRFIECVIAPGSTVVTDDWKGYNFMDKPNSKWNRHKLNHDARQFVDDDGKTNNQIESYWSIMKKSWYSVHHSLPRKRMHLYCAERDWCYNNKTWDKALDNFLKQITLFPQVIDIRKMGRFGNRMHDLKKYRMILPKCLENKEIEDITLEDILCCNEPVYGILREPYESRKKRKCGRGIYPQDWKKFGICNYGAGYKDYRKNYNGNTPEDVMNMLKDATRYSEVNQLTRLNYKRHRNMEKENERARIKRLKNRYENLPSIVRFQIKQEFPNILRVSDVRDTLFIHVRISTLLKKYNRGEFGVPVAHKYFEV